MKKRLFWRILICTLVVPTLNYAQPYTTFAPLINPATIRQHVEVLASDSLEGRGTSDPGMQKAVRYVENQFKSFGLNPPFSTSYTQEVPFIKWNSEAYALQISHHTFIAGKDFYFTPPFSSQHIFSSGKAFVLISVDTLTTPPNNIKNGFAVLLTSNVNNIDNDSLNKLINQKIKIVSEGKPATIFVVRNLKGEREQRQINRMQHGMLSLASQIKPDIIPVCHISHDTYHTIQKAFKKEKDRSSTVRHTKEPLQLKIHGHTVTCNNVGGVIKGSEKADEYIILTAHLDHLGKKDTVIYYGADDDGSGCATVMNIAAAFSEAARQGTKSKRSILFLLFTGEEKGLLGSTYFTENSPMSMDKAVVNLNIDMIGRSDTLLHKKNQYVYLIGSDKMSTDLHQISEATNDTCCDIELDYTYNDATHPMRLYYRSDHYNFVKKGVPAIFYFTGLHDDYHQPTDTPEKLDYIKAASIGQLVFSTAWELANRNERITVDLPIPAK